MRKRLIRILLIIIAFATSVTICLVSGVHVYLKTEHAQKLMLAKLNEVINGELLWQDIAVSLLKGRIGIRDAVLRDSDGRKLASFDDLSLDLSLMSLFKGRLVMEHAKMQGPWVYLGVDSNNTMILMQAFSPRDKSAEKETKGGKIPLNVVVDELIIVDGAVLYENKDRSFKAELSGIELTTNADLFARSMDFTAQAAGMSLIGRKINADLQRLLARTSLRKNMLDPILIQAETGLSKISMKGSVKDLFTEPDFDLIADVSLSLSEFKNALGLSDEFTGEMVVRVGLKGTLDNPEVRMHLDYGGGIIAGLQVDSADLDAGFIDRILEVKNAHAGIASGSVATHGSVDLQEVFPEGIFSGNMELNAVSYSLSVNGEGLDLERLSVNNIAVKGRLNTNINISGTGISPESISSRISAEISCEKVGFNDNGPTLDVFMKVRAAVENSVARIDILDARSGQTTLEVKGSLDLSSQEIMARIEIDAPDLKGMLKPFGVDGDGRLAIAVNVSEAFSFPRFEFSLNGKQLWFEGITLGDIACTGGLDRQGIVRIANLILENKGSRIQGSGSVKLFEKFPEIRTDLPLKVAATIYSVEVQDFIRAPGLEGILEGELSMNGTMDSPDAQINLGATGVTFKDYRIGNVRSAMGFAEGMFSLEKVIIENNQSRLYVSGVVKVFDPETMRLITDPQIRISLEGTPVFLKDVSGELTGRVSVAASIQGSMMHPEGTVSLAGEDIDLGFQQMDEILVLSTIKNQRFMADTLKLVPGSGDEPIIGTGWFSLQKEYAFQLSGSGISLENIDVLAANHVSKGKARFSITGNGTFADPSMNGDIILTDVFVNQKHLGDVAIILDLHDNIVRASGKQGLDFSVIYRLRQGDFSASVLFDNLDLAPYFQIARYSDIGGTVTGKIESSGNIHNIPDIKASIDLAHLYVNFMEREIVSGHEIRADLAGKEFSVPGIHLILGEKGWMDIEGSGMLHGTVSLRADGDIPLQVLDPFIEELSDTSGSLLFSGQVELIDEEYVFMADLELNDIGFMIPYTDQLVNSTNGHIVITPKTLAFNKITGRSENGRFDLSGTVALEDMKPEEIDIKLQASSLPIRVPNTLDLLADMEIVVKGTRDDALMQGRIVLLEGLYYKDVEVNLIEEVVSDRPETRAPGEPITLAFLRNMKLDISIKRRNPLYVDNNLAQLDINPDIHISGTVNNPVMNGRASIESGTVVFRNRTFTVTKGVLDFLDPYSTKATIDIESEVKVRDWMIYLGVSGTPDALNISLRSEPPEEDNDILSLIVIGRTSQELITGEGGSTLSTSSMIASLIASRYGEDFRKAAGFDILELESGADDDSVDTVKLTVGKEISRRIMLKYAMESKNSELSQRAVTEYKLFENIVLNGFQDTRGIFGADVQYRLEFR